ncbi:MAG: ATP-binding cassette domain-containing protein [Lachnospira sp.]
MDIEIKNIVKILNRNIVLNNISLNLSSGKIYGLKGKNGCGKTMLMRAICGMIHLKEGTITIDGKQLDKDITFPESVGALIENPAFLGSFSGFKNLKLLADIKGLVTDEQIRETIAKVGLDPNDKRSYRKYSLGMKQKLGIAAAIMENPDLIILDEPINALDDEGVNNVREILLDLKKQDKLIIIACHDYEELVYLADTIIEMNSGSIVRIYDVER